MGIRALLQAAIVVPQLVSDLKRAGDDIRDLRTELAQLQSRYTNTVDELHRVDLAFTSFRQRVYAWRKGGVDPTEPPAEKAPLDKAAILAAHRGPKQ